MARKNTELLAFSNVRLEGGIKILKKLVKDGRQRKAIVTVADPEKGLGKKIVTFFRHFFWGVCDSKGRREFKHLRYISSYTRVFTVYDAFLKKEENVNSYVRTKTSASGRPLVYPRNTRLKCIGCAGRGVMEPFCSSM